MKNKHLKKIIEKLLRINKKCREDTKYLTYLTMRHYTNIFIPFEDFKKIPSFESIARYKREIMNKEGKFKEDFIPEKGVTYEKKQIKISEEAKKVLINARGDKFTEEEMDILKGGSYDD